MHVAGGNIYRAKQYEGHGSTSQVGKALNKMADRAARGGWGRQLNKVADRAASGGWVESSTRWLIGQQVVGG